MPPVEIGSRWHEGRGRGRWPWRRPRTDPAWVCIRADELLIVLERRDSAAGTVERWPVPRAVFEGWFEPAEAS